MTNLPTNSKIRAIARQQLQNQWGIAVGFSLLYTIIVSVISFILGLIPVIGYFAYLAIAIPFGYALQVFYLRVKRRQKIEFGEYFNDTFNRFGRVWSLTGSLLLRMILPILAVVGGAILMGIGFAVIGFDVWGPIVLTLGVLAYLASLVYIVARGLDFTFSYFILFDRPQLNNSTILDLSTALMHGHKWKFIGLGLSFIGWMILSALTFGIGFIFLTPYIAVSQVAFYDVAMTAYGAKAAKTKTASTKTTPAKVTSKTTVTEKNTKKTSPKTPAKTKSKSKSKSTT